MGGGAGRGAGEPAGASAGASATPVVRIFPPAVQFDAVEPGVPHSTILTVKNVDTRSHVVKISHPLAGPFRVLGAGPQLKLAPGLETSVEVEFHSPEEDDFHDKILVLTETERIEVPLHALRPVPKLEVAAILDYGVVVGEKRVERALPIRNAGDRPLDFKIAFEKSLPLSVSPTEGTVGPHESLNVAVELAPTERGLFSGSLQVSAVGGPAAAERHPQAVEVSATVVSHTVDLLDTAGAPLPAPVDMGTTYFGGALTKTFVLVNNGPSPVSFFSRLGQTGKMQGMLGEGGAEGEGVPGILVPGKLAALKNAAARSDPTFLIEPKEGTVGGYERQEVVVTFCPQKKADMKGFASAPEDSGLDETQAFDYTGLITIKELDTKLKLPLAGRGLKQRLAVTPAALQFGDVAVNEHADGMVTITNRSSLLPARFDICCTPNFRAEPRRKTLPPGQEQDVLITYLPKVLGKHREQLNIEVKSAKGVLLDTVALHCTARSSAIGPKKALVGGTDRLPEDFRRVKRFVNQDEPHESEEAGPSRFQRSMVWEDSELIGRFSELDDTSGHTLTMSEHEKKYRHRQHYAKYLKLEHRTRKLKQIAENPRRRGGAKAVGPEDNVNLGLQQASGLRSPQLELPDASGEELWMDRRYATGTSSVRPRNRPPILMEEGSVNPSNFLERPQTSGQVRSCAQELSAQDICKLAVGPRNLNFGAVSAMSKNTKFLAITNDLDRHIVVRVLTKDVPELKDSKYVTQVVKPKSTTAIPITLVCPTVQSYAQSVTYLINEKHIFDFNVLADVVPVSLDVNKDDVLFEFSTDNFGDTVQEKLLLSNPNSQPAEFHWENSSKAFTVEPAHGVVPGKAMLDVTVTWRPTSSRNDADIFLNLIGGTGGGKRVRLEGRVPEGKLSLREKSMNFSKFCVGEPCSQTFTVKNVGSVDTIFVVETAAAPHLTVNPKRGRILVGSMAEVEVTMESSVPNVVDTLLQISSRGGKVLKLPIAGEAVVPEVEIGEDEFRYESVYIGGAARLPLTLRNTSPIEASLTVDLSQYEEFGLDLPNDWKSQDYQEAPLRRLASASMPNTALNPNRDSPRRRDSVTATGKPEGHVYKLSVKAETSLCLQLVYRPVRVHKHAFELPMMLAGAPVESCPPLQRVVVAEGLRPRLVVSNSRIDFSSKIVLRNNAVKIPYPMEVELTNNDDSTLKWEIGTPSTDEHESSVGIFQFHPQAGMLERGSSATVRVTFLPRDKVTYSATVPLYLDGNRESVYVELEALGQGSFPQLSFDLCEVTLPSVPLDVESQATFHVVNNGYDNLELSHRLPTDTSHVPLTLEFPEGKMIGIARERLPVIVKFSSSKPISFTSNIEFLDEDGNRYKIPVSGVSDNCILSIHSFLACNPALELSEDENAPVRLLLPDADPEDEGCGFELPVAEVQTPGAVEPSTHMLHFLNAATTKGPFGEIPHEMVASKGRLLMELIEVLSGKQVPGKVSKYSFNKREAAGQLCSQYEKLLTFLKTHGALLNFVKPEFLLDAEDFMRVNDISAESLLVPEEDLTPLQQMAAAFDTVSVQSWNAVLLQTFKIFILARVTPKALRSIPGFELEGGGRGKRRADRALGGSNIYSVAESVLLSWATAHYQKALPAVAFRVRNFSKDLRDGLVFYSLLVNHWPSLSSYYMMMRKPCKRDSDYVENAETVVRMLAMMEMPYKITAKDILNPDPKEMLIYMVYLFQTLPQLIPKSAVKFQATLGNDVLKHIELTNPTNKPIVYSARLEGHRDFTIDQTAIRLEPRSSANFGVAYKPTIAKASESRLVFTSRGDGGAALASSLVFVLEGDVQTKEPLKSVTFETKMYEHKSVEVEVDNPFPQDSELHISIQYLDAEERPPEDASSRKYPDPFGSEKKMVRIKKGESYLLPVHYLPFRFGTRRCLLLFEDKECGQFAYSLAGTAALPSPFPAHKFSCSVEDISKEIAIPFLNPQVEAAKKVFLDKHPLVKDKASAQMMRAAVDAKEIQYEVEKSSQYISLPDSFTSQRNPTAAAASKAKPGASDGDSPDKKDKATNALPLTLHPRGPGTYPARIVLTSDYDIRVLDVEFHSAKLSQEAELEFECPARQQIVQEVPLVNNSEKALTVRAVCTGECFSGPRELVVPVNQTANYPLGFKAPWIGEYTGQLELNIQSTGETITYRLKGKADDPVAEKHVVVECQARNVTHAKIKVPNLLRTDITYKVYSDLPFISGEPDLKIGPGGSAPYTIGINAPKSGVAHGSISFTTDTGHYVWFTLELQVARPPEVGVIDVSSTVREAVAVEISLTNPLSKAVDFSVQTRGEGLMGHGSLHLGPEETAPYELIFSPLRAGQRTGSIHFVSDSLGEFWYKLVLEGTRPLVEELGELRCELGRTAEHPLRVNNPTGGDVVLHAKCSNLQNFRVTPATAVVKPFGSAELTVEFTPSALNEAQGTDIEVLSNEVGAWHFSCSGLGLPPTVMAPVRIASVVSQQTTATVAWRNPFAEPQRVTMVLDAPDVGSEGGGAGTVEFTMLDAVNVKAPESSGRQRTLTVAGFGSLQIPIAFRPQSMHCASATLHVEAAAAGEDGTPSEGLKWEYPLVGVTEALHAGAPFKCTCQVRSEEAAVFEVPVDAQLAGSPFTYALEVPVASDAAAVRRALKLVPEQQRVGAGGNIIFNVRFEPQIVFQTTADLLVTCEGGGRWRYRIALEATEPDIDGTLTVYANVLQTGTISVPLPELDSPTEFIAFFTPDSPAVFEARPYRGILGPGSSGVQVAFSPSEYGKEPSGTLVVQTSDMQWMFLVNGTYPAYVPPDKATIVPKISTKLRPEAERGLKGSQPRNAVNYVRSNIAASQSGTGKGTFRRRKD